MLLPGQTLGGLGDLAKLLLPKLCILRQTEHTVWGAMYGRWRASRAMVPMRAGTPSVMVGIAPGELLDEFAVPEIKAERIGDPAKLRSVRTELTAL
jgi:hypothetical protein